MAIEFVIQTANKDQKKKKTRTEKSMCQSGNESASLICFVLIRTHTHKTDYPLNRMLKHLSVESKRLSVTVADCTATVLFKRTNAKTCIICLVASKCKQKLCVGGVDAVRNQLIPRDDLTVMPTDLENCFFVFLTLSKIKRRKTEAIFK